MEGSYEIKGVNSISKPKIVFHKYANGVRKVHIKYGCQTGLITKNGGGENLRYSSKKSLAGELLSGSFDFFVVLLYSASVDVASVGARVGRHLGFVKNFGGSGSEESSIPSGTFGQFAQMS